MNYCTSCGAGVDGAARFCGNCGAAIGAAQPAASLATPGEVEGVTSSSQPYSGVPAEPGAGTQASDIATVVRANPDSAIRAAVALALVIVALVKPWEVTSLGFWGETAGDAAGSNGWSLVILLLVGAAAAVGFFAKNVEGSGLPVPPRVIQVVLVLPFLLTALVMLVRMVGDESLPGVSVAIGLVAAVLAIQVGAQDHEAEGWHTATMVLLGVGVALSLWGMAPMFDLNGIFLFLLVVGIGWIPLLAFWFINGLRQRQPAEWAALVVFGGGLLVVMFTLTGGLTSPADVGLMLFMVAAAAATAPGVAELMALSSDPAERWLQWVAGIMVLWIVAGAVTGLLGLLGAISVSDLGVSPTSFIWVTIWGTASAIAAGVARKLLVEDPARGRKIAAGFAVASMVLWVVSLAAADVELADPATLLTGLAVSAVVLLMLTLPRSVNQRFGSLVQSSGGPTVD